MGNIPIVVIINFGSLPKIMRIMKRIKISQAIIMRGVGVYFAIVFSLSIYAEYFPPSHDIFQDKKNPLNKYFAKVFQNTQKVCICLVVFSIVSICAA